jgi:hypothetical protein
VVVDFHERRGYDLDVRFGKSREPEAGPQAGFGRERATEFLCK